MSLMKSIKMKNYKIILIIMAITCACMVFIISPTIFSKHQWTHMLEFEFLHTKENATMDTDYLRQTTPYGGTDALDRRVTSLVPRLLASHNVTRFVANEAEIWRAITAIHTSGFTPPRGQRCAHRLPGCIIVGNYKAGTRELIDFMAIHPNIVIKRDPYEIGFFSSENQYRKGTDWYRQQMPCTYSSQIAVEKTPNYFQSLLAPHRIREMNPDIKLISLFREPVSTALSHCSFHNNNRQCDLRKFGFVNKHRANFSHVNMDNMFIKHSIYDEGLARYYSMFNRSQLLIINYKDFARNPYIILTRVEAFLELEPFIKPHHFAFSKEKQFNCVSANTTTAVCYGHRRGRSGDKPDNRTVAELNTIFEPHNERFFQLLGYRMDW